MNWVKRLMTPITPMEIERAARSAAVASLEDVRRRVGEPLGAMSRSEARGYLRARARRPVAQQVCMAAAGDLRMTEPLIDRIVATAIDQVAQLLLRQQMVPSAIKTVDRAA